MDRKMNTEELDRFMKLAGVLKEEEGVGTDYDESSDSESDDTDAMGGIDEAGNIKGIKIEIPGNSYAADFGKAAAKEVLESFGPREVKNFIEAFVAEIKKSSGGM